MGQGVETILLANLLMSVVRQDSVRADIYEFFKHSQDVTQAYSTSTGPKYYIVPEPPNANVCRFSFETDNPDYFMPLILGGLRWGIPVPISHVVICEPKRICKISLESVVSGYVLREDNSDYGIESVRVHDDSSLNFYRSRSDDVIHMARERRMLSIIGEIDSTMQNGVTTAIDFSFITECLWYPLFGNKRVVKYLRSALQGAIGKITDPLHIAQLMVKCGVAAPRLREVLFAKSDDGGVQK